MQWHRKNPVNRLRLVIFFNLQLNAGGISFAYVCGNILCLPQSCCFAKCIFFLLSKVLHRLRTSIHRLRVRRSLTVARRCTFLRFAISLGQFCFDIVFFVHLTEIIPTKRGSSLDGDKKYQNYKRLIFINL